MHPTIHGRGQGARLVVGRSRKDLMRIDTSAFSQLQKPAVDPGPAVPGELPIRTFTDVTKGLGLSYEAERDLTRAMEEWMAAPDPVAFRGRVTRGLRSFAPDNYGVRNELWRRCASLYRSTTRPDRRPQSIVIQKAMARGQLSGVQLEDIARRASAQMSEHFMAGRPGINRWKVAEFLRMNPNPTDAKLHDFAREIGIETEEIENIIYQIATEHAKSKKIEKSGEKPPGTGWQAIPKGKKGGFRKRSGAKWEYWYPERKEPPQKSQEESLEEKREEASKEHTIRLYHTSPEKIERIHQDGLFGSFLFFAGGVYVMTGSEKYHTYHIDIDPDEIIEANEFYFYEGDKLNGLLKEIQELVDCDEDTALELLSERTSVHEIDSDIAAEDLGEVSWELQHLAGRAARQLGYRGVKLMDEQGTSWLIDMYGREKDLKSEIKKSNDGWGPMPGIEGGLRRAVAGGYEYRFPPADMAPEPDPALARVFNTRAVPQPPELLFCYSGDDEMSKAAGHKYIRRTPTGKSKPKYRYLYKHPQRKGLVVDEHLVDGSKFKVEHAGHLGHFEVLEHHEKRGIVKVKHDESGRVAHIHKHDLARMLEAHHAKRGKVAAEAVPVEEKAAPPGKLPRVQMADLARGEWEEVVGFEPTEAAALELAGNLKNGWDYAVIKQSNGFMVVAKRQRGAEPSPRERHGAPVKVFLRNEKPLSAVYTLMEADDVVASHNPISFNVRKDYPEGVQERQYHESEHEQKKVMRIAQEMEPVFVINNNPDGVNGTPIVDQDGVVLGGNARAMGIQRAYKTVPDSAKKYKNYLVIHARDYGFKAADIRNMKAPVLIRRTKVDKRNKRFESDGEFDQVKYNAHLRLLGRRMNEGLTQGLDPRAEEVALGKNFVNDRMLRTLTDAIKEGQTLDQFLQTESSRDFVKTLWSNGILDDLNAGQYAYSKEAGADKGLLNKEGRTRLERILVGKMIDSPSLLDRMTPTQRQALANSAVHVVVAQQSGWDVVPQLKRAIRIDQSIQKMEKELDAIGEPRLALKNFLSGKQTELPGVSGMVEEVRTDKLLHHLLVIVREKAGTTATPRDFKGFALRAREDAKKNPEFTGAQDMFGGEYAAKREDPADALDIEFGVTPPRKKEKTARRKAAAEEKTRLVAEKKERARQLKEMAAGGLFRSMSYELTMIKAGGEPNRLVTRAINHVEFLVDAAVSRSMQAHGEIWVDGAKIARQVLTDINEAIRKDPELAREQGRSPIDARTVRGFVEAFCQMRGKDLLEKSTLTISADGRIGRLVVKARVYR